MTSGSSGGIIRAKCRRCCSTQPDAPTNEEDCHEDSIGCLYVHGDVRACLDSRRLLRCASVAAARHSRYRARRSGRRRGALRRTQRAAAGAVRWRRRKNDGSAARQSTGDAEARAKSARLRTRGRVSTLIDPAGSKNDRRDGEEDGRLVDQCVLRSRGHLCRQPETIRRGVPVEHDWHVPRRSQQSRPHRGGGAARGGPPAAEAPAGRATIPPCSAGRGNGGGSPLWPEFNRMIGGYFKFHWVYPTPITVRIDDPKSPINAAFKGRSFNTIDEVYTFNQDSWSRENLHVLTSIDYSLMTDCEKGLESTPRTDHDYGLIWIRREGKGRVFYEALGHSETIYYNNPAMLDHLLAGMQYALGDLAADDSPSGKPLKKTSY